MPLLTDFLANNPNVAYGLATAFTTLNAGEAVAQGDVIVQAADGNAYYAIDPTLPYANLRPISQAAIAANVTAVSNTSLSATASGSSVTFALSNGNAGIIYAQSANLYFTAIGPDGAIAVSPLLLASDFSASYATPSAIPLSGGGFSIAYMNTGTSVKFGVYSNSGAVVSAIAAVAGGYAGGTWPLTQCQMTNGNIVVSFSSTLTAGAYAIYTAAGAAVLGATSSHSAGAQQTVAATSSGFVLGYVVFNGNDAIAADAYSLAGAFIAKVQTTVTSSGYSAGPYSKTFCIPLSNGNVAVARFASDTSNGLGVMIGLIISPTGTAVVNNLTFFGGSTPLSGGTIVPLAGGAFEVVANAKAQQVSATGVLGSALSWSSGAGGTTGVAINATVMADGSILIAAIAGGGTTVFLSRFGPNFVGLPFSSTSISVASDNPIAVPASISMPLRQSAFTYLLAGATASGVSFGIFASSVQACQPVGVAKAAAAQGQPVTTQALGGAQTRLTFAKSYSINAQGNTPPGQKMSVVGNLAILNGIQ